MCGSVGKATRRGERGEGGDETWMPIWFGSYNIPNSRNGGLDLALRGVVHANLDMGVLQETKFTKAF